MPLFIDRSPESLKMIVLLVSIFSDISDVFLFSDRSPLSLFSDRSNLSLFNYYSPGYILIIALL